MEKKTKIIVWTSLSLGLVFLIAGFIFFKFCFVYSEGVNEGDINYFQKEGFIFKTYEGKMILTGFKAPKGGNLQSNELKFSVASERVARQLEEGSSVDVKLHWKRYLGTLPWRGNSQYVVDSVSYMHSGSASEHIIPITDTLPIID